MRWDVVRFWVGLAVIPAALLIAGVVSRGGKHGSGAGSQAAAQPSRAATTLEERHRQQIEALGVLVDARRKCAGLQAAISRSWRSAIDQGLDPGSGFKQVLEGDPQGEAAAARAAEKGAEAAMGDPGMREGDLGPALLDYSARTRQICDLALAPAGHSLAAYDADSARLAIAATAQEVKVGHLLGEGAPQPPRRSQPSAAVPIAVTEPPSAAALPPPAVSLPELTALAALPATVGRRREGSAQWAKRAAVQAEALDRAVRHIEREGLSETNCRILSAVSQPGIGGPVPSGKTVLDDLYARALISFAEAGRECSEGRSGARSPTGGLRRLRAEASSAPTEKE